ncbi:MAG: YchJ family metal-binding protein [Mycobacterium sp.]
MRGTCPDRKRVGVGVRADYLLHSWHPSTRPARLDLDDAITWRRLQIVDTQAGGADDATGVVEFRAQYEVPDRSPDPHRVCPQRPPGIASADSPRAV